MYNVNVGPEGYMYVINVNRRESYMYIVDVNSKGYIYILDVDRLKSCIYSANINSESYIYILDIDLIPDVCNANMLYVGPESFIYATNLPSDCYIL